MALSKLPSKDEMKEMLLTQSTKALGYLHERPLWVKLSLATTVLSYGYIRYKWSALNGSGFATVAPSIFTFGTAGHYASDDGIPNFGKAELIGKNRKTVAYYRLTTPIIFTIDIELIKQIFTTHFAAFPTRMPFDSSLGFGKEFRYTLDQVNDPKQWKRLRSTMAPGFSSKQLGQMLTVVNRCLDKLIEQLRGLDGVEIDAKTVGGKFSFDAFLQSAMSVDMNEDLENIKTFAELPLVRHFLKLLNPDGLFVLLPLIIPGLGGLLDKLGIYSFAPESIKFYISFCKSLLAQHAGEGRSKDFLNLFNENQITDEQAQTASKGATIEEIIGNTFVLLAAGFETTATTLCWALYELAKDRDLQQRVQDEANSVDFSNPAELTPEKMPLICSLVNEVLRFHPPVGLHLRRCVFDVNIGGHWFKKDYCLEVPVDTLHQSTEYWGEDAGTFVATRFMDNPALEKEWFYMPFGAGPRNCIGMRFALMETRAAIGRLVQNFNVDFPAEFVDDVVHVRTPTTFMKPSKNIMVTFADIFR